MFLIMSIALVFIGIYILSNYSIFLQQVAGYLLMITGFSFYIRMVLLAGSSWD